MKKWKINILSILLLASILSSCTVLEQNEDYYTKDFDYGSYDDGYSKEDDKKDNYYPNTGGAYVPDTDDSYVPNTGNDSTSNEQNTPPVNRPSNDIQDYINTGLSDEQISMLQHFFVVNRGVTSGINDIKQIEVNYKYSDLYQVKDIIHNYVPLLNNNIIVNNQIDGDRLYAAVKANNEAYMNRFNIKTYQGTTDAFVLSVCRQIELQVNEYLKDGIVDVDLLNEKLSNLKIFTYLDYASGFYSSEKGLLALNVNNLSDGTVNHEIVHLVQAASAQELANNDYTSRFGYCYRYSETEVNPTYWNWFFEAAAESLNMEYNNSEDPGYYAQAYSMIEAFRLSNFKLDTNLEKSLFKNDLDSFYKWFNASTEEEKKEINNMFYSLNIILSNNPGCEGVNFYRELQNKYNFSMKAADIRAFEDNVRGSVALTESKMFYQNLLARIDGKSVSLKDVFGTISVFELELSRQTWYNSKYASLEEFLKGYDDIQTAFFEVLSVNCNISVSELKELYFLYNANVSQDNIYVPFLSANENDFLKYIVNSRYGNKMDAILKVYFDNYQEYLQNR